ncbi:MAG TPA: hypothetical protein VN808_21885 [Stellaceae bacterium]|nr:hypothetical protein [Stellaceae bacterium]
MDYDRLAMFLSNCTTPGFRRSLGVSPHDTLGKCGFHPGEAALLIASLAKGHTGGAGTHERLRVNYTFQQIDISGTGGSSFNDDWYSK